LRVNSRRIASLAFLAFAAGVIIGVSMRATPFVDRVFSGRVAVERGGTAGPPNLRTALSSLVGDSRQLLLSGTGDQCDLVVTVTAYGEDYMAVKLMGSVDFLVPYASIYRIMPTNLNVVPYAAIVTTTAAPHPRVCTK
jgi:hypothetical protein